MNVREPVAVVEIGFVTLTRDLSSILWWRGTQRRCMKQSHGLVRITTLDPVSRVNRQKTRNPIFPSLRVLQSSNSEWNSCPWRGTECHRNQIERGRFAPNSRDLRRLTERLGSSLRQSRKYLQNCSCTIDLIPLRLTHTSDVALTSLKHGLERTELLAANRTYSRCTVGDSWRRIGYNEGSQRMAVKTWIGDGEAAPALSSVSHTSGRAETPGYFRWQPRRPKKAGGQGDVNSDSIQRLRQSSMSTNLDRVVIFQKYNLDFVSSP